MAFRSHAQMGFVYFSLMRFHGFIFALAIILCASSICLSPAKAAPKDGLPYVGNMQTVSAKHEDTLLQIMRDNNVGYVEIRAANPDVDIWLPGEGTQVIIPSRHILPDTPKKGIVINLSEMRLYSYVNGANKPITHPIGIGREGLGTPTGTTKITRKKAGPSWRPTPRMREENPSLPAVVPPGDTNPLGTHALYLGWPAYLIHGTLRPWGIGRRVSSGCIRMLPEDIIKVFKNTPVGTPVRVIKQPFKLAWIDDTLYLEAHADEELADGIEKDGKVKTRKVPSSLFTQVRTIAGKHSDDVDWDHVKKVAQERRGYPIAIFSEKDLKARTERKEIADALKRIEAAEKAERAALEAMGKNPDDSKPVIRRTQPRRGFNN